MSRRSLLVVLIVLFAANCFEDHLKCEAQHIPGINKIYRGKVVTEELVNLPADKVWAVYRDKNLPALSVLLQPVRFEKIDVLEGDGGEGTVIRMVLKPGFPGPVVLTDKFTTVDDKTMTKVLTQIRDGWLDPGFSRYIITYHITPKGDGCSIKSTTEFEVKEGSGMNATSVTPNWKMADSIVAYIARNYTL